MPCERFRQDSVLLKFVSSYVSSALADFRKLDVVYTGWRKFLLLLQHWLTTETNISRNNISLSDIDSLSPTIRLGDTGAAKSPKADSQLHRIIQCFEEACESCCQRLEYRAPEV